MTLSRFQSIMSPLVQFFKPAPSEDEIRGYYDLLNHIPEAELEKAVVEVCRTRKYPSFPLPGEIQDAHALVAASAPPVTSDDLRDRYGCPRCHATPGWVTYHKRADGKVTDGSDPLGYYMAAPCGECELGRRISTSDIFLARTERTTRRQFRERRYEAMEMENV